jgi:hypothetical protein
VAELLTSAGYPTKEKDLKNTRRMLGPLPENTIPMAAPGVETFIKCLRQIWSTFEWWRMIEAVQSEPVEAQTA